MTPRALFVACVLLLAFAACASKGGQSAAAAASPGSGDVTTATGKLVKYEDGTPYAGVTVKVLPWPSPAPNGSCSAPPAGVAVPIEDDGCPSPLPAPQATTGADGTFSLVGVPNGRYLLVIGDDSPTSAYATIHDQIVLAGGVQALRAPVLPPVPTYTPKTWETDGTYRIATLDPASEAPCIAAFNAGRATKQLPPAVADEWLMENTRAYLANSMGTNPTEPPWPNNPTGTIGRDNLERGMFGGMVTCADQVTPEKMFREPFGFPKATLNPQALWLGISITPQKSGGDNDIHDTGMVQIIADPRNGGAIVWP